MERLNLQMNENLMEWGIIRTAKQKPFILNGEAIAYDVYQIPLELLVYNPNNGRMFMEARRFENEENISLEQMMQIDLEKYNDEVENLIWSTNEEKNIYTKKDIEDYGQLEPGVILGDGIVIDGNRRFTCLRKLHRENPTNEKFKYFQAAIVLVDGEEITKKQIKEYEIRVQFGTDVKVEYSALNRNLSIYELIEKEKFEYAAVAELMGKKTTSGDIVKICRTCRLVDEFLKYIGQERQYQIAEDLKIYFPLEALVSYMENDGKKLTLLEQNERKHLFFDYLLTLNVSLTTQNLRDQLIKNVFKDKSTTNDLINKHNEIIGKSIHEVIENSNSSEEFLGLINELKNSEAADEDKEAYNRAVYVKTAKNQIDIPLRESKDAVKSLKSVNIAPLINVNNELSKMRLQEIYTVLEEAQIIINRLQVEIKDAL